MATAPTDTPRASLWVVTIAPAIWAVHLLLSYISAAVWCAKVAQPNGSLGSVPTAIAWYTGLALAGITAVAWDGWRRHRSGMEATTHDLDTPGDRYRFLGFAMLLLAGLSAVAVLYSALAATYFDTCR